MTVGDIREFLDGPLRAIGVEPLDARLFNGEPGRVEAYAHEIEVVCVAYRRHLAEGCRWPRPSTINKIAKQLSGGGLGARSNPEPPRPDLVARCDPVASSREGEKRPYTKVSLNGRVIVVDFNSGRQLYHIGEIRGQGPMRRFILATRANRFFAPLEDDLANVLRDLDGAPTSDDAAQEELVQWIEARLGFSNPDTNP